MKVKERRGGVDMMDEGCGREGDSGEKMGRWEDG